MSLTVNKIYKPKKMLGNESFGCVYEAKNIIFGNSVAMKVIKKDKNIRWTRNKKIKSTKYSKIYEFYI